LKGKKRASVEQDWPQENQCLLVQRAWGRARHIELMLVWCTVLNQRSVILDTHILNMHNNIVPFIFNDMMPANILFISKNGLKCK
jgi:hypothetical protein